MRIKVLIVEDEQPLARGLGLMIEKSNPKYDIVDVCKNGILGIEAFRKHKPDVVFVDINMPIMNGLEMISELRNENLKTQFIVLTGYAVFEYAQTAVKMGVIDYLLKPLSPVQLDNILNKCYANYVDNTFSSRKDYVQQCLLRGWAKDQYSGVPFKCFLLLLYQGTTHGDDDCVLNCNDSDDNGLISESDLRMFEDDNSHIFHAGMFNGVNVFATIIEDIEYDRVNLAKRILKHFTDRGQFVNISVSEMTNSGANLFNHLKLTYHAGWYLNKYGTCQVSFEEPSFNRSICVSNEAAQLCSALSNHPPTGNDVATITSMLIAEWKKNKVTYAQLAMDLKYVFGQVARGMGGKRISLPDQDQMIIDCFTYDALEKRLCTEICRMCGIQQKRKESYKEILAAQVKNWIECNYTTNFTYKIFPKLFGYNEKYISFVYKEIYGVTPSKYVESLRINTAKTMLRERPELLITDVSAMLGFSDQFYFSKVFKLNVGISPSEYVRSLNAE